MYIDLDLKSRSLYPERRSKCRIYISRKQCNSSNSASLIAIFISFQHTQSFAFPDISKDQKTVSHSKIFNVLKSILAQYIEDYAIFIKAAALKDSFLGFRN